MLELCTVIQRHGSNNRRCDQIEEEQIEYPHHAVDNNQRHICNDNIAADINDQVIGLSQGDVKVLIHSVKIIDAFRTDHIRLTGAVIQIWFYIVFRLFGGRGIAVAHRTDQKECRIERNDGIIFLTRAVDGLQRVEARVLSHDLHAVCDGKNDTFILLILVDCDLSGKITGLHDLLNCILPGIISFAFRIFIRIEIVEHLCIGEIFEIAADIVIASIDIIAAFIGGIQRIVADRIQNSAHCGEFFIRKIVMRFSQSIFAAVIEYLADCFHQLICKLHADEHDQIHADNDEQSLKHAAEDLSVRHFHLIVNIKHFLNHRDDCKDEDKDDTDRCHAEINAVCDRIREENRGQVLPGALIGYL